MNEKTSKVLISCFLVIILLSIVNSTLIAQDWTGSEFTIDNSFFGEEVYYN